MPTYFTYFISSLPMLHFGARPPFSYTRFLKMAEGLIPETDIELFSRLPRLDVESMPSVQNETIDRYFEFEKMLRNELVRVRSQRRHLDPAKYLRGDGYTELTITHLIQNALRNPSIIEAEKMLDAARWEFLDGLAAGHYFDTEFLTVYAYKLLLLERWERIRAADQPRLLEEALTAN